MDENKTLEEKIDEANELLSASVHALLIKQTFLGHLVQMLNRTMTTSIPTAAVAAINNRYCLMINPHFYTQLTPTEAVAILQHELFHLLNDHLKRARNCDPRGWNIGADLAINCYIPNLPSFDREEMKKNIMEKFNITAEEAEKQLPPNDGSGRCCAALLPSHYNLPERKSAEFYYLELMQNKELQKKLMGDNSSNVWINPKTGETNLTPEQQEALKEAIQNGEVTFDFSGVGNHEKWDTINGQTAEILDEELKRMIRECKDRAPEAFGNLPGEWKEAILKFLSGTVNWKAKFRAWLQKATEVLRVNTRKRPSRRFGIVYPGQRSDFKLNLGVYVDSSGSIGMEDLRLFGGEINRIFDTKMANIEIMVGDIETHEHYSMKRGLKPEEFKVSGRGGTDAAKWIEYANHHDFDAVVILTDGYFDFKLPKANYPVLWALTTGSYSAKDFHTKIPYGKVIQLTKEGDNG